jgi:MYXO-CTERM domain-containing protein
VTGNGTDQLYFGTDATGLTATQLSQIAFYSDSGTTFLGIGGYGLGLDGELVPVPEPGTWFAAALALGALAFTQRRRYQKFLIG